MPENYETDREQLEQTRTDLVDKFTGKVYFETSGETIADVIIEKEMKKPKTLKNE